MKHKSIVLVLLLAATAAFGQSIPQTTYEEAVDYVGWQLVELSIKSQNKQPHYQAFKSEVGDLSDYVTVAEFLKTRKPKPLVDELYLLNHINTYKGKYTATASKHELYYTLANELFVDSTIKAFAARQGGAFAPVADTVKDYLNTLMLTTDVPAEYDDATTLPTTETVSDANLPLDDKAEQRREVIKQAFTIAFILILIGLGGYFAIKYLEKRQQTTQPQTTAAAVMSKSKEVNQLQTEVAAIKERLAKAKTDFSQISKDIK